MTQPHTTAQPFWPRRSPHFAAVRAAVRPVLAAKRGGIAVGLSGGPDSLALAAAVAAEYRALHAGWPVPVALKVAQQAVAQAREWGIEARIVTVRDLPDGAGEAEARVARYRVLAEARRPVMVGHTADDQAETLLLAALRGQVTGMAAESDVEGCTILRPLLHLRRADTEGACAELGVEPWRDPHNANPRYRRVRIRHEVLPLLADVLGGDPVPALAQAAVDAAADDAALARAGTPTDDCEQLAGLDPAVRRRAIRAWLLQEGLEPTRAAIDGIAKLCTQWHGQGGVAVRAAATANTRLEVRRIGGKLALLTGK